MKLNFNVIELGFSEDDLKILNWAVSVITNPEWDDDDRYINTVGYCDSGDPHDSPYAPAWDWSVAGPIIANHRISLVWDNGACVAWLPDGPECCATDPLIAAMRCLVLGKHGDEIEIPARFCHFA